MKTVILYRTTPQWCQVSIPLFHEGISEGKLFFRTEVVEADLQTALDIGCKNCREGESVVNTLPLEV